MTDRRSVFVEQPVESRLPTRSPDEPVSAGQILGAHWTLGRQDFATAPEQAEQDAYGPIVTELASRRHRGWLGPDVSPYVQVGAARPVNSDAVWRDVAAERQRDPSFLKDVPATSAAEFGAWVRARELKARRGAQDVVGRQSGLGQNVLGFAADLGTGLADPINLMTLPLGGGIGGASKTLAAVMARGAITNTAVEAIELPMIASNRAAFGEEMSATDMAADLGMAALGGAVFEGAGRGLKIGAQAAGRAIGDSAAGKAVGRAVAPATLRFAHLRDAGDLEVAQTFARDVPAEHRTLDEQAAIHVLTRQADIDAARPYLDTPEARDRFAGTLTASMERMLASDAGPPAVAVRYADPVAAPAPARGGLAASDQLMRRIARVENATGDPNARNPLSSATGKYQFTDRTWLSYYKREVGADGLTDAAILARRGDGALQDRLMGALTRDNAAALHRAGQAETAGNLYLMHFAGPDALKVLRAEIDTPIERVLGAKAIEANPFLRGKTTGEVVAWAHGKMGEPGAPAVRLAPEAIGDDVELRAAQAALDDAELARMDTVRATAGDFSPAIGGIDPTAELVPWNDGARSEAASTPAMPQEAAGSPSVTRPAVDAETQAVVGAYVRDTRDSVVPARMAAKLGIDEDVARAALAVHSARPNSGLVMSRAGVLRRAPQRRGPVDLNRFLAEMGGIADDEGHDLARGMGLKKFVPGVGPLIRKGGMALDRARELAAEAGYFHDRSSDEAIGSTTTADFLDLLDQARGNDHYTLADLADAEARDRDRALKDELGEIRDGIVAHLADYGFEVDRAQLRRAAEMVQRDGLTHEEAIVRTANEALDDALDALGMEAESGRYDDLDPDIDRISELEARRLAGGDDGRETGAGDAGAGSARPDERGSAGGGRYGDDREAEGLNGLISLDPAAGRALDDPNGAGATAIANSLEHDVLAGETVDPDIADRRRQEARLRADAPMRVPVDQDSTIGSPLFDAADQPGFRLDEEGGERPAQEILDEIDADEAAIAAARNCL